MQNLQDFLNNMNNYKQIDIPCYYRNQFKSKESLINPNFYEISQKLLNQDYHKLNKKWDKQSKQLFILIMIKYFQMKNKKNVNPTTEEWRELTNILGFEEQILKQRWITLITPMAKSLIWEKEEDDIIKLQMNVKQGKHIWTEIALELYNHNNGMYVRTPKQVRERWMNYLNPVLKKSSWTDQEDTQLLSLVMKNGKKWSKISKVLDGRTENQVKNRYKSLVHRIYQEQDDDIDELIAINQYLTKKNLINSDQKNIDIEYKNEKEITQKLLVQKAEKDILIQEKKIETEIDKCEQDAVKQENYYMYLLQQLNNQFCFSTQGNYDSQSIENRSSISDLNHFGCWLSPDIKNKFSEQNRISTKILPDSPKIQEQQQQYKQNNYIKETATELSFSNVYAQTDNHFQRQEFYLQDEQFPNLLDINQQNQQPSSIVYSPLYFYNNHFTVKSPFQSPMQSSPQSQQILEEHKQNEIKKQNHQDIQFQFLNNNDIISNWKNKRKQDLQNLEE